MRLVLILCILPLLLSLNPPIKKKLSKEILGEWTVVFHLENGNITDFSYMKIKQKDNRYNGFEFLKNGELIVNGQKYFCGTGEEEYESMKGSWSLLSDSTVSVSYKTEFEEITRKYWRTKNEDGESVLKYID